LKEIGILDELKRFSLHSTEIETKKKDMILTEIESLSVDIPGSREKVR